MKGRSHHRHELSEDWNDDSWTVDCVCGVTFDDGEEMVNCDDCGVWVHTRCSRYVKGEDSFTCDKCKSKNNSAKDDSEETEVAQFLVELPTKTLRLDTATFNNGTSTTPRPIRLWTDIPMEERVHVQGIPGGDPHLFTGLSSVFTPELWKCTGYVPKKFNFNYREFPSWDEQVGSTGRNEDDNENTVDKGAGVLFSLAKESLISTPATALIGMRGRGDDNVFERRDWVNEDGEVRHLQIGVNKERSLLRSAVIHSSKRRKEDLGTSKERSAKKKARIAYNELDAKKRASLISRIAFTSTGVAKPSEFFEDRGPKPIKSDALRTKNKTLRATFSQQNNSDHCASMDNGIEKAKNSTAVTEHSSETLSVDISRNDSSTGAELNEEKVSHEGPNVVVSFSKLDNLAALIPEHDDVGRLHAEQEGHSTPTGNVDEEVEGTIESSAKPRTIGLGCTFTEVKVQQVDGNQKTFLSSKEVDFKVDDGNDDSKGFLSGPTSATGTKDPGTSLDNALETSKVKGAASNGSPSCDHKAQEDERTSEPISHCHPDKQNDLASGPVQMKQDVDDSLSSIPLQKSSSEPKLGSVCAEARSKSGGTAVSSSALSGQTKIVLCVGKSSSTSGNFMMSKSSADDTLDSYFNSKQRVTSECNAIAKKDRVSSDVSKAKDEDRQDMSRKTVTDRPKYSMNSAPKVSNSSKISHTSALKGTVSDLKDINHQSSSRASSAHNSSEAVGLLPNEPASHVQNKAPTSGLPVRVEKFNQSNRQSSSKAHHVTNMNPPVSANLSDEELALLLHQELNSSPRVHRVPRRHSGSLPQLASPTATSVLVKRTSSSGGRDHCSVFRRKNRDSSKDGFSRSHAPDRVPSSPDSKRQDMADESSKREDNESPAAVHSVKKSAPVTASATKCVPSSEVNHHHLHSSRGSPRNVSDEDARTVRGPVHRTLPGLINEIMSKGRRMTYEDLCNAVLPHWHHLRKHNGERYAYSSPSQAVLDCLRNRHEWAQLVDRGPKTSSSRKRRKLDAEESEDNDYGKGRTAKEGEGKSLGKRKARKRRRLALQGRGIKEIRKRRKADMLSDDDSGPFSNSSDGSVFSEEDIRGGGGRSVGSETSASSDETV